MEKERKKDIRKIRTEKFLSDALLELLSQKSLEEISVRDVCEKAMINRSTFYKTFVDIYDLFEFIINKIRIDVFEMPCKGKMFDTIMEYFDFLINTAIDFIYTNKIMLSKILQKNNDEMIRDLFLGTMIREFETILRRDEKHFQIPIDVISNFYVNGFVGLVIWFLTTPEKYSKNQFHDFASNIIKGNLLIE